jgi:hypothetical protein
MHVNDSKNIIIKFYTRKIWLFNSLLQLLTNEIRAIF